MLKLFIKSQVWKNSQFWKFVFLKFIPLLILACATMIVFIADGTVVVGVLFVTLMLLFSFSRLVLYPDKSYFFNVADEKLCGWVAYVIGKNRYHFVVYDGDDVQISDVVDICSEEDYDAVLVADKHGITTLFARRDGVLCMDTLGEKCKTGLYQNGNVLNCCIFHNSKHFVEVITLTKLKFDIYYYLKFNNPNCMVEYLDYLDNNRVVDRVERDEMLMNASKYLYVVEQDETGVSKVLEVLFNDDNSVSNVLCINTNSVCVNAYTEGYPGHYDFLFPDHVRGCYVIVKA